MIFHFSIAAEQPRHTATVLAEILGGEALPFPPVIDNSWIVLVDDGRGSGIEVYPAGTVLRKADGDATGEASGQDNYSATHAALGTSLPLDAVMAIAAREGWPAKYCKRGGMFGVIELWVGGRQMLEILTPGMQAEYTGAVSIANWRKMLEAMPLAA